MDKYLFLIRCYVGVAFEIFLKGKINSKSVPESEATESNGQEGKEGKDNGKKRKRKGEKIDKDGKRRKHSGDEEEETASLTKATGSGQEGGKWAELESYVSLLEEGPLCPINFDPTEKKSKSNNENDVTMPHGPDGLRYHIIDIWLDELEKVFKSYDDAEKDNKNEGSGEENKLLKDRLDVPIELLLRPFENLKNKSQTKSVRLKVLSEVLEDDRLVEWGFKERRKKKKSAGADEDEEDDDDDDEENGEWEGFDD